jgi:predicted secreted protein
MTKIALPLAALAAFVIATPALADETAPAPKPEKERKICRSAVATGSIMARRTCRTKAEWDEFDAQNQQGARDLLGRRNFSGATPGAGS